MAFINGIWCDTMAFMAVKLTIDRAGRLVLPKPIRDAFDLEAGAELEIETGNDSITLRPVRTRGHLRKKGGVWVYNSGSGKIWPREVVNEVRDRTREERDKKLCGGDS